MLILKYSIIFWATTTIEDFIPAVIHPEVPFDKNVLRMPQGLMYVFSYS